MIFNRMHSKLDDDIYANLIEMDEAMRQARASLKTVPATPTSFWSEDKRAANYSLPGEDAMMVGRKYNVSEPVRWTFVFSYQRKWILPMWVYPHDYFPQYLAGPG